MEDKMKDQKFQELADDELDEVNGGVSVVPLPEQDECEQGRQCPSCGSYMYKAFFGKHEYWICGTCGKEKRFHDS